jgi:hypothetical protein
MEISPPGASVQVFPGKCILYGFVPAGGIGTASKPLEPFTVYAVSVDARPENSNLLAYLALFCMRPNASGKLEVVTVSRSQKEGDARFQICKKPAN